MKHPIRTSFSIEGLLRRIATGGLLIAAVAGSFSCDEKSSAGMAREGKLSPIADRKSVDGGDAVAIQTEADAQQKEGEVSADPAVENRVKEDESPAKVSATGRSKSEEAARLMGSEDWNTKRIDFYSEWAETAPEEAIAHARKNNPGASTACISSALESWAKNEPASALAWVEGQTANAERSLWAANLATDWPEDRLEMLAGPVAAMADSPAGQKAVDVYAGRLMEEDPTKAFQWMNGQIADPLVSARMVSVTMGNWAARETEEASGWLAAVPTTEPWRDDAIAGLVQSVASLDRETAKQWAGSISDEKRREALVSWLDATPVTKAAP